MKVSLELLSETYNIKSDLPEAELMKMQNILHGKMATIQKKQPNLNYKTIAVLSGLELASDFIALKKEYEMLTALLKEEKLLL